MKSMIITTKSTPHNEWLAFSSWYSIHRNSPTTKIGIIFPRKNKIYQFTWLRKCQVPFIAYPEEWSQEEAVNIITERNFKQKPIVISDNIMMIRSDGFNSEILPANSQEIASLVDISVMGKFNLSEWMEKEKGNPFHKASQLFNKNRTVNEQKVISLWRQMATTFDQLNR